MTSTTSHSSSSLSSSLSSSSGSSSISSSDASSTTADPLAASLSSALASESVLSHSASVLSKLLAQATSTTTPSPTTLLDTGAGSALGDQGVSLQSFVASLAVAAIVFGIEVGVFVLLRKKLQRVYEPRTYLVPEKRRTMPPAAGLLNWFKPVFATASSDFIAKSGLDAYFFLRYLLMLLKIFLGLALVILPILLPINFVNGKGAPQVNGLDRFAWSNVRQNHTSKYWAHLFLALLVITSICYMLFVELRKYIRMRQMYLTSPQHRLRASATTVLVSSIPKSWLSVEKLVELYDVFPGGIRNVWINRDYDKLQEKVDKRDDAAKKLESAETALIRLARKKNVKALKKAAKNNPKAKEAKDNMEQAIDHSEEIANGPGISSGNPHQIPEDIHDTNPEKMHRRRSKFSKINPLPLMDAGVHGIGKGVMDGVTAVTGGVLGGVKKLRGGVDGYVAETSGFDPNLEEEEEEEWHHTKRGSTLMGADGRPTVQERSESGKRESSHSRHRESQGAATDSGPRKRPTWGRRNSKISNDHMRGEEDETPLSQLSPVSPMTDEIPSAVDEKPQKKKKEKKKKEDDTVYEKAYNEDFADDNWGEPVWKKYLTEKDRPTHRLPIHKWLPSLPLIGKKVDTIYYCRKEVARLNVEIEKDQENLEKYPVMNSAFVQFNQQVAAHMACQAVSHHVPQHMSPRYLEVSPNDVIWGNLRIQWWERYIRYGAIMAATIGLIIGWAIPVAVVGSISQIDYLKSIPWLKWINKIPEKVLGIIAGILPPILLGILMALLPIILRTFAKLQGVHTNMAVERSVQGMYFAFLFIQIFLVVSISSGISTVFTELQNNPFDAPTILAQNLPKASNFFFSYLLLQAFSVSGGALVQIGTLLVNFLLAPIMDTTARDKFKRATSLMELRWGTFFPIYTNLACIGIVYSVISPLIMIFNILTFSLFWLVYRYNLLFVVNFRIDTGGLLFPRAINQLFTGLYVMEICLIGLFFLVQNSDADAACVPQAIIMIIATACTVIYQFSLNGAFGPLLTYLPVTLEDDAALRDEQFAREQSEHRKHGIVPEEQPGDDLNDVLEAREKAMEEHGAAEVEGREPKDVEGIEMRTMKRPGNERRGRSDTQKTDTAARQKLDIESLRSGPVPKSKNERPEVALFHDIADEIEDLTPEERDVLVGRAFQHPAARAKRPVIWIPRDELGVSDDEIRRTNAFSDKVWISNEYAGLDRKGQVMYRRSPPDFDMRDLIEL